MKKVKCKIIKKTGVPFIGLLAFAIHYSLPNDYSLLLCYSLYRTGNI